MIYRQTHKHAQSTMPKAPSRISAGTGALNPIPEAGTFPMFWVPGTWTSAFGFPVHSPLKGALNPIPEAGTCPCFASLEPGHRHLVSLSTAL